MGKLYNNVALPGEKANGFFAGKRGMLLYNLPRVITLGYNTRALSGQKNNLNFMLNY